MSAYPRAASRFPLISLVAVATTVGGVFTAAGAGAASPPTTSGQQSVVITLKDTTRVSATASDARAHDFAVHKSVPQAKAVALRVPADRVDDVVRRYRARADVAAIEVDVVRQFAEIPDDPSYALQQTHLNAVTAPAAWNTQHGSASVKIAVVDSGVDAGHPDLAAKIVGRYNAADGSTDVTDTLGHGTFVAGVAAAATDNGIGVAGAGYDSSILAAKVDNGSGGIPLDYAIDGIVWAAEQGATVINCSFAGGYSTAEYNAIRYAQSLGSVVVAAAGNYGAGSNPVVYPAAYPGVIAVGATSGSGRAYFSEYGPWVTVAAPGVNLYSTAPRAGSSLYAPNYDYSSGTSFSSPLVAGEVALLAAQSPTATAAELRAAVVNSAHGFGGLGLGAGQVDFAAALALLSPATTPEITAPPGGSIASGVVAVSALSSAARVQFRIDGSPLGSPVSVVGGVASATWTSYGAANGTHTVTAADCSGSGSCGTPAQSSFTLANPAPALTAPAPGQTVTSGFALSASAAGGGVAFYVDGVRVAFDGSAPYSTTYTGNSLADGPHTVTAVSCSVNGAYCAGPRSAAVSITSVSLHPYISSISPNPFSPNGDGRMESTTARYTVPVDASVTVRVLNSAGQRVRGPLSLGTQTAGAHSWVWSGHTNLGARVPNGTYTVTVTASATVGGVPLSGTHSRTVRVDRTAPALRSATGNGYVFHPYPDGYRDSFRPAVTTYEAGTLRLYIWTRSGRLVRSIPVSAPAGRVSITYNGRDAAGHLLPAGTYLWRLTVTDAASNVARTGVYPVYVRR